MLQQMKMSEVYLQQVEGPGSVALPDETVLHVPIFHP